MPCQLVMSCDEYLKRENRDRDSQDALLDRQVEGEGLKSWHLEGT